VAVPRVFISSTFYDLRHIREALRNFVATLGFVPVLSEEGAVFYDPNVDAADACLTEVGSCQLYVLIIGGRYGSEHLQGDSVTRAEYHAAVKRKIPTFTLVEAGTLADYRLYEHNKHAQSEVDADRIAYPNADDIRIFEFISEVGEALVNNAFVPFNHYDDIERYLRKQWAGMFNAMLQDRAEQERVVSTLEVVESISERIEVLTTQILKSVGTDEAKATAAIYAAMLHNPAVEDLQYFGIKVKPSDVLEYADLGSCAEAYGTEVHTTGEKPGVQITGSGYISPHRYEHSAAAYSALRTRIQAIIEDAGMSVAQLREQQVQLSP
jgi:hypothetical protein